jgi:hypothetical protein
MTLQLLHSEISSYMRKILFSFLSVQHGSGLPVDSGRPEGAVSCVTFPRRQVSGGQLRAGIRPMGDGGGVCQVPLDRRHNPASAHLHDLHPQGGASRSPYGGVAGGEK